MNVSRPMRVFVLRGVDGVGGGADKIILRNAAQIDPQRVQMRVCFLRHVDDPHFDLDRRAVDLGIDCSIVEHRGPTDRRVLPHLSELVRNFHTQLLHSHDYKANFFVTCLARRYGLPRVATSHGWTGDTWRERAIYYPADKWLLRYFSGVIAVSDEIRQTLLRWGAQRERIHVLLNGVDPNHYRRDEEARRRQRAAWGCADEDWVIGAVGRVERQKRFDVLLAAFEIVYRQQPRARLVIVGEGSLLPTLQSKIVQRGLQDVCRLAGHCATMRDAYQAFDLLVQSSDYEGTPTVVVEAMACEVPIVATDVGGTAQLMHPQEHGLLVPRRRPDALATAVLALQRDPVLRTRLVAAARQRVEQELTYEHRVARLTAIYEELIHRGKS